MIKLEETYTLKRELITSGTRDEIITIIGCNLVFSSGKPRPKGKHVE
jgi:hypothetical protein